MKIKLNQATSIYFNELVYELKSRGKTITTLSLGEAFFELPKPDFSQYKVDDLIHYTSSRGHPKLINSLIEMYGKCSNVAVNTDQIMITAGSKIAIYMALLQYVNVDSRRNVGVIEPAWVSYDAQINIVGGVSIHFPYSKSLLDIAGELDESFSAIIVNNPNNPSGLSYSNIAEFIKVCEKKGIIVIVDEAYSEFISYDDNFLSATNFINTHSNLIVVNSLSKNLGMSGFRIGYVISNQKNINELVKINQHLITCAPTILQIYVADNLLDFLKLTAPQIQSLLENRKHIIKYCELNNLKTMPGKNTFYFMLDIGLLNKDNFDFCIKLLLLDGIAVVPGVAYGDSSSSFVRISIGRESPQIIIDALNIIKERLINGWSQQYSATDLLKNCSLPVYS